MVLARPFGSGLLWLALAMATVTRASAQELAASPEMGDQDEMGAVDRDSENAAAPALRGFADVAWGVGLTSRSVVTGSAQGRRAVSVDFVPALALRVQMGLVTPRFRVAMSAAYQTSVAAEAFQPAPAGVGETTALRSHRFVGGVAAHWFLGESGDALGMFLGYGLRSLYSVQALLVPAFTLHGPTVAIQLWLTALDRVELHLAPELQLLTGVPESLQNSAGLKAPGVAFGGDAELRLRLWPFLALGVLYRETHADFSAVFPEGFADRERYVLLTTYLRWL